MTGMVPTQGWHQVSASGRNPAAAYEPERAQGTRLRDHRADRGPGWKCGRDDQQLAGTATVFTVSAAAVRLIGMGSALKSTVSAVLSMSRVHLLLPWCELWQKNILPVLLSPWLQFPRLLEPGLWVG